MRRIEEGPLQPGEAGIIGSSPALRYALQQIELVAPTEATVLLLGESGTGKELFARALHARSSRRDRPLVTVSAGAIPRELFESEFMGHARGAFTGAIKDRVGRFELADEGTLFLDEVGEIPLELQSKLLRVLQEHEFERVGDCRTKSVDFRLIAATNRDLRTEASEGRFREDLYYRLNVFPIQLPPLRERVEDVPELVEYFAKEAQRRLERPPYRLTGRELQVLCSYSWPGNVRELAHLVERAVILSPQGSRTSIEALLPPVVQTSVTKALPAPVDPSAEFVTESELRGREKSNLLAVLTRTGWKVYGPGGAADVLGMKPTTRASRLKALGIRRPPRGWIPS
jgi:transcriptional regulator with GAF, ATPase, and Fis domain